MPGVRSKCQRRAGGNGMMDIEDDNEQRRRELRQKTKAMRKQMGEAMNEKETMEAALHRVIDEKEALLAEREQLLEALEAALFALCTVETTECAAARYRARAAIAKARGEERCS